MKKLLILLGSVTLSLSPVFTIVSCGTVPVVVPVVSPAAGIAAAALKTEIYGEILGNYNKRIEDMSKTMQEVDDDGHAYSYLSLDNMKSKFSGDNTTIDLNSAKLTNDDLLKLTKDLNYLLDLEGVAKDITEIASNQTYDIITSQVGKKVFKGWVIIPHSLSRVITSDPNADPEMVQFSFSMAVSYQIYLEGSVQTITSDKINCSFTLTTDAILKNFIMWANNTIPSLLYSASDSTLRFDSNNETFKLHSDLQWIDELNDFKKNFNSNINNYFQSDSFNKDVLSKQLNTILQNPKDNGFKPNDNDNFDYSMDDNALIKSDNIIVDNKEVITPQAIYGSNVDYASNIKRLDILKFDSQGNSNPNQDIIDLVFGSTNLVNIDKLNKASQEFADFNSGAPGSLIGAKPPLDNDAFKQNYLEFIKKYNPSDGNEITPDDNNNKIYSYGNINLEPIAIKFKTFSGTFNLNLNVPWSFSLYQDLSKKDVDRRFSTMNYFDALDKWKQALNVNFFGIHPNTSNNDATSFMTLDTYDKGGASHKYVDVDPNFYNNDKSNDPNVYNMIGDMNNTDEGSYGFNLDDNSIAKSSVWDNAIGKYSRNGLGLTQYYFEKYAGLLPDKNSPLGEESPWQWKNQSRIAEENGLVYFGFHYDTDENETPVADVSMPFTNLDSIRRDVDFQLDADGSNNLVPKMWHSKIRHEQDDKYNGNNLVYTLSMGNFGLLNLSFPSFNLSEKRKDEHPLSISVNGMLFPIWEYLWNPGHDDRLEAMRIIADNCVVY